MSTMNDLAKRIRRSNKAYFAAGMEAGKQKVTDLFFVAAHELGMRKSPAKAKELLDKIKELNADKSVTAILVQLPLPEHISKRLKEAFKIFDKKMKGFISDKAVLIAIETRTSTPVRILRNPETFESTVIKSLYPCGEGSGYSGGIVSSAMDGENAASRIVKSWQNQ